MYVIIITKIDWLRLMCALGSLNVCRSLLKQVRVGHRPAPGVLKLLCFVCQYVCVFVCPPPRALIISGVVWCDYRLCVIG